MAVHKPGDNNANKTQESNAAPDQAGQASGGFGGRTQPRTERAGLSSMADRIYRPLKKNQMGEILAEFNRAASNIFEHAATGRGIDFRVLPLDAGRYGLHYSAAILTVAMVIAGKKVVSAYTMILEGSAQPPRPTSANIYGQNVEVLLTAMDAWDEETLRKVQAAVIENFDDSIEFLNAGAMTVPADIDVKDEDRIYQIIWSAHEAAFSVMESSFPEHFEHFDINSFINRSTDQVVAQFAYNATDGESVTGLPVRSDISINVSTSERNTGYGQFNSFQHQTGKSLLEVDSFVDLVYSPPQTAPAYGQPPISQIFVPRVVITRLSALDAPYTPEMFFMGLAIAQLLGENYAWAGVFSNYSKEEIHDIGGIGYRLKNPADAAAPSEAIDTKSNTFGQNELFDLIQTTCHAQPVFSIDCEDVGPDTWLTGALVETAHGNRQSESYLVNALDNLTGGAFSRYFQGGPMVISEGNRVHVGTYLDSAGAMRDLREIDSLAILNLFGHNDMNAVNQWEATFNDMNAPIELRLERRMAMIRQITTNKLKVRGFAERVTFTPEFLSALIAAVHEAGLMVDQDGLQSMYGNNYQVGNTFIGQYVTHGGASNMVNTGTGPAGNFATRRPMSRW